MAAMAALSFMSPPVPFEADGTPSNFSSLLSRTSSISSSYTPTESSSSLSPSSTVQRPEGSISHLTTLTSRLGMEILNFHQTSEESFEARLMAGGYSGYGSSFGAHAKVEATQPNEPSIFVNQLLPSDAPEATPPPLVPPEPETPEEAKLRRKERRLAAFRRGAIPQTGLRPVEVEGRGRILLDFTEAEEPRPRTTRRRRIRAAEEERTVEKGLSWPDDIFPWSLRTEERREREAKEEEARMRLIEKFLEHLSDEEEEEEVDEDDEDEDDPEMDLYFASRRYRGADEDDDATMNDAGVAYEDLNVDLTAFDPKPATPSLRTRLATSPLVHPTRMMESSVRRQVPSRPSSPAAVPSWRTVRTNDGSRPLSAIEILARRNAAMHGTR